MKTYHLILTKDSGKYFLKLSQSLPAIGRKISKWIDALKTDPHLGKKLQGSDQKFPILCHSERSLATEGGETSRRISFLIVEKRDASPLRGSA